MKFQSDFFATLDETFTNFFLEDLGHPNETLEAAVTNQELALGNGVFAVSHEPGGHVSTADGAGQGGYHAAVGVMPV